MYDSRIVESEKDESDILTQSLGRVEALVMVVTGVLGDMKVEESASTVEILLVKIDWLVLLALYVSV